MTGYKILFASPREPSGVTWLVNCCLVLGLKSYTVSSDRMWRAQDGQHFLKPDAEKFRKWLPVLSEVPAFHFVQGCETEWTHAFPDAGKLAGVARTLLFIRDPRDALLSRYKRDQVDVDFATYLRAPEPDTGVDKVLTWRAFMASWLQTKPLIVRFEDYKKDATATLTMVLKNLGIGCSDDAIAAAVAASDFRRAQQAEAAFKAQDRDQRIANRAGAVGEWRQHRAENTAAFDYIDEICQPLLAHFSYDEAKDAA